MPECNLCGAPAINKYQREYRCQQCRKEYRRAYARVYSKAVRKHGYNELGRLDERIRKNVRVEALLETIEYRRSVREELASYVPQKLGPPPS